MAVAIAGMVQAGEALNAAEQPVSICMSLGPDLQPLAAAEKLASKMFAAIGVTVGWPQGRIPCPRERAVIIDLSYRTADNDHPGAWAYALPYEGSHVVVFWDRIQLKMPATNRAQILLAHVLVHEITHILEGVNTHSESGIMKAHWSDEDLFEMMKKPLSFTASDIRIIHFGLGVRSRTGGTPAASK